MWWLVKRLLARGRRKERRRMPMLSYDEWARRQQLMRACPALWATVPLDGPAAARGIVHGRRLPERECRTVRAFVVTAEGAVALDRDAVRGGYGWWAVGAYRPITDTTARLARSSEADLGGAAGVVRWTVYEYAVRG